jgi:hypothetical protein
MQETIFISGNDAIGSGSRGNYTIGQLVYTKTVLGSLNQ